MAAACIACGFARLNLHLLLLRAQQQPEHESCCAGIDANDGPKCLTVFNYLCILLSSLPQLPVCLPPPLMGFKPAVSSLAHVHLLDSLAGGCSEPCRYLRQESARSNKDQP